MSSIGLACNFYQEVNALPGLLENASQFFDDIVLTWCGPKCEDPADDPSVAIAEKWGVRLLFDNIDDGYGAVRTRLIRNSTTEWVMIMDADERFLPLSPVYLCEGEERYPDVKHPNLKVSIKSVQPGMEVAYNQGALLRQMIHTAPEDIMGIRTGRRHWFDFSFKNPCQNWFTYPDYQLRLVRNRDWIEYKSDVKMHEQIIDTRTNTTPVFLAHDNEMGPFHDHFHCFFKSQEKEQRARDIQIYDALHEGREITK